MHFYKKIAVAGGYADNPLCFLDDHSTVATVVYVDDSDSIFFKQKHVGKGKTYFPLYKFCSMKMSTPHDMPTHMLKNPEQYITKVGKILRKSSLDELPQN